MSEVLLYTIIAVLALMVFITGALVTLLLTKERKPGGWSLAKKLAKAILYSGEVPNEVRPFVVSPQKCTNCKGDQHLPRWKVADAHAYLRRGQLAKALAEQKLCTSCLNSLAKLTEQKKVAQPRPVPAVSASAVAAPAVVSAPAVPPVKEEKKGKSVAGQIGVVLGFLFCVNMISSTLILVVSAGIATRGAGILGTLIVGGLILATVFFAVVAVLLVRYLIKK